jgi:hypothetical protein
MNREKHYCASNDFLRIVTFYIYTRFQVFILVLTKKNYGAYTENVTKGRRKNKKIMSIPASGIRLNAEADALL